MATAQAQSGLNMDTALTQQMLGMTSQHNPWGNVDYDQTGTGSFTDSTGRTINIPRYTQTTTLSPEQQQIFDKSQGAQSNIAGIAQDQSAMLHDYLSKPFEFNNQDAADWSYDLGASRILPQQQHNEQMLRTRLINSGLHPGTQAWNSEMERMTQGNSDQLNQLALQGRGQAFGEALATRAAPINEITALMSGSQVTSPGAMSGPTPQPGVAGTDYSGLVEQNYAQKLASHNAMMGGLFGLAGNVGSAAMMSDVRLKTDIKPVGVLANGLTVYSYRFKSGGPVQIGLIAQEVQQVNPDAVQERDGYLAVDYAKAVA